MIAFIRGISVRALMAGLVVLLLPAAVTAAPASMVYIPNFADGTLSVINSATNSVTATIPLSGTFPEGIALTPDGSKVLLTERSGTDSAMASGMLAIINTATNAVVAQIPAGVAPTGVVTSPDGTKAYFVDNSFAATANLSVVDLATDTVTQMISVAVSGVAPFSLAIAPDGSQLYVVSTDGSGGGRGTLQIVNLATNAVTSSILVGNNPAAVAVSPDNSHVYVANSDDGTVSVVTLAASRVTSIVRVGNLPFGIAVLPNGSQIWVGNATDNTISVINASTNQVTNTFSAGTGVGPSAIGFTPDGTTAYVPDGGITVNGAGNTVSVISTASGAVTGTITVGNAPLPLGIFISGNGVAAAPALVSAVLPDSRSVQIGNPATIFATIVNASTAALSSCQIGLPAGAPAGLSLSFETTNPTTNAPTGTPNTPIGIPVKGSQSFLLTFTSTAAFDQPGLALVYSCAGVAPAPLTAGLNTVDLLFSTTAIADVIALEATATPGVVDVPFSTGGGSAFAVASDNVGAAGALTVSVDTGTATLPVVTSICQTNPTTGACLSTPSATVPLSFGAGATPTFSVFVSATAPIAFNPGGSRLFVRFKDSNGTSHGSTSVAVQTD